MGASEEDAPNDLGVAEARSERPAAEPTPWEPATRVTFSRSVGFRLPRKEVIQPHVPVRLPCYDFVPVANLTFNACLPEGLAQRLQVLPTPMT